jgi:hypothetical protein
VALVRDWRRQAARAAGASLIFPAALLAVAVLVAAGGGLGGLGSLGQVASGPQLPATDAPAPSRAGAVESAGIVAVDPSLRTGAGSAATPGTGAGNSPSAGGSPRSTPGSGAPTATPAPGGSAPVAPVRGGTPPAPSPGNTGGGNDTGTVPRAPDPVQQIIDDTRGVGKSLPAPLGPTTGPILDPPLGNAAP